MLLNVNAHKDWVILGRFGRPHGVKGSITVISFTQPRENILEYEPWYATIQHVWQPVALKNIEVQSKSILVQVEGYTNREQAASLTNLEIAVQSERLPVLNYGEYYWHQLIGMSVINVEGIELGSVIEIMPTGANDVLIVSGKSRHLIPYLPDTVVMAVDDKKKVITVDWDTDF